MITRGILLSLSQSWYHSKSEQGPSLALVYIAIVLGL